MAACCHQLSIEFDQLGVAHPGTAEQIEGRSDREINPALTCRLDRLEILQAGSAACVGRRDGGVFAQETDQVQVHPATQTFHIHGVDQEFAAVVRKFAEHYC